MNNQDLIHKEIQEYLSKVESCTKTMSKQEQTEILQNLKSHIYEALKARNPNEPTLQDVRAVIAEMDPPEYYTSITKEPKLKADNTADQYKIEPLKKKLCWQGVLGIILIPIGLIITIIAMYPMLFLNSILFITSVEGYFSVMRFFLGTSNQVMSNCRIPLTIISFILIVILVIDILLIRRVKRKSQLAPLNIC